MELDSHGVGAADHLVWLAGAALLHQLPLVAVQHCHTVGWILTGKSLFTFNIVIGTARMVLDLELNKLQLDLTANCSLDGNGFVSAVLRLKS